MLNKSPDFVTFKFTYAGIINYTKFKVNLNGYQDCFEKRIEAVV